jgi:hypothetical protein
MSGGKISGNTASAMGGGVNVGSGTFTKSSTGGVITGYGSDTITGNKIMSGGVVVTNGSHAVCAGSNQPLQRTVPANKALNSSVAGEAGGWTE